MPKTPDEIKKGLECCGKGLTWNETCGAGCPYQGVYITGCSMEISSDALALIQQLQDDNAEKCQRIRLLCADIEEAKKKLDCWHDKLDVKIDKVEAGIVKLIQCCNQLQAERDAAVKDLQTVCNMMNICRMCKDADEGSERCEGCLMSSNWQWRGVTKEE